MILQALYRLSEREGLVADPDYEPKRIAWLVRVAPGGALLGIEGTHYTPPVEGKRKPKAVAKRFSVPRQPIRTSGDAACFLCDKAEYVFGIDPAGERQADKLAARAALYRQEVAGCLSATGDEGVAAVAALLDDVVAGRGAVTLPQECAANDLFAFVYAPDVDRLVSDRDAVRRYWKDLRAASLGATADTPMQCLVSGERVGSVENYPQIKKVPGKNTAKGISLVSFNANAFESYGWRGNENAPVSRAAAEASATALNRLLDPAYPDPAKPAQTLPERFLRLSADTAVCYWAAEPSGDALCDVLGGLLQANPGRVAGVYRSIWRGREVALAPEEESAFYALILSGQQGRVIVRDWFESTVATVSRSLAVYFDDLAIVRNAGGKQDSDEDVPLPMGLLLESLAPQGDRKQIPAPFVGQIVRCALQGTQLPFAIIERCVQRARAEIGLQGRQGLDGFSARRRADARAALLKAVLNRRKRFHPDTARYKEVHRAMDPLNASEGYVLGCLMAVLERVQQAALGGVNATVVDRYFSGASATPKVVFVRLLKGARNHVAKAKDGDQAGLVFRLERIIDALADRFDPKRNGFPAHLDLEQQGLFVLGYHQMRRWLWMSKDERSQWESTHRDAPAAYLWSKQAA